MATKYLTLRAELVETGKRECDKCIFGIKYVDDLDHECIDCGIEKYPKNDSDYCEKGYWKEIDLAK